MAETRIFQFNLTLEEYNLLADLMMIGNGYIKANFLFLTTGLIGFKQYKHKPETEKSLADKFSALQQVINEEAGV